MVPVAMAPRASPTRRAGRTLAALGAAAALAGCGSASGTAQGHATVARGALAGFLANCGKDEGTRVLHALDAPAARAFIAASGVAEGCAAVVPPAPGIAATGSLFSRARIASLDTHGDSGHAVVVMGDGSRASVELESTPSEWKVVPSPGVT
jgi:hypothetical protein